MEPSAYIRESEADLPELVFNQIGLVDTVNPKKSSRLERILLRSAVLGAMAFSLAAAAWSDLSESGDYKDYSPSIEQPAAIDNEVVLGSWNTEGQAAARAPQIAKLIQRYNLNYVALQEVATDDAQRLHKDFPAWHVLYVLADRKQNYTEGGYGNVLMTRQEPGDITTSSFPGSSFEDTAARLLTSVPVDVADMDFSYTAWQESRAAIAMTTKAMDGDKTINIRIINGHITGNSLAHTSQLKGFTKFNQSNTRPGQPTFICGDFNDTRGEINRVMGRIGFTVPNKMSSRDTHNGDFCAYNGAGLGGKMRVRMVTDFKTDHYPNIATVTYPAPSVEPIRIDASKPGTFK